MYEQKNSQNYGVMQRMQHILEALTAAAVFLSMKLTKTKFRAKLMDTNLKNQLRVAQSTLNTDIKGLASVK